MPIALTISIWQDCWRACEEFFCHVETVRSLFYIFVCFLHYDALRKYRSPDMRVCVGFDAEIFLFSYEQLFYVYMNLFYFLCAQNLIDYIPFHNFKH